MRSLVALALWFAIAAWADDLDSRVERLVFGASDPKAGYCGSLGDIPGDPRLNHRLTVVSGVLADECGALLRDFFRRLRREREGSL